MPTSSSLFKEPKPVHADAQGYRMKAPKGGWDGRRVSCFGVSVQFFEQLLQEGLGPRCFEIIRGIPEDGKVVAVQYVPWERCWYVAVESEMFEPLKELEEMPKFWVEERAFYRCKCQPEEPDSDADD